MKVKVYVRLKSGVLDVQGKAVERGLKENGFGPVENLRIGRLIEFDLPGSDATQAKKSAEEMCRKVLANPIIESFEILA
jgi:phosphoribosylformylglycinamidine synthase